MNNRRTAVRPYGDTADDGKVQVSFTLPMEASDEATEAARRLAEQMGLRSPQVVLTKDLGEGFSFFVVYGPVPFSVDATLIRIASADYEVMDFYRTNEFIEHAIGRKLVVVGACTGDDAHTVGLDAIMNMKGFAGEYGLERYPWIEAHNLGSQVPNERLIARAVELNADAILVSQVVTQKNVHIHNLTALVDLLEAERLRDRFVLVVGGPRISHELALELGYDAGFGVGTLPFHVASYVAQTVGRREPGR